MLKNWKDEDRNIHFFWGLGGANTSLIRECIERKEEWWYVDVGYFTEQITRYMNTQLKIELTFEL